MTSDFSTDPCDIAVSFLATPLTKITTPPSQELVDQRHTSIMAANGEQDNFSPGDVLSALTTMKSGEQEAKKKAHQYLESFQKSVRIDRAVHGKYFTGADNIHRKVHGER